MARGTIIRRQYDKGFTVIGNEPMDDRRLSVEALGLLCYLRSRPDNWKVLPNQLRERFRCGRDRVYRMLDELIQCGYVVRIQKKDATKWGSIEYLVSDIADATQHQPIPENPHPENSDAGNYQEKPLPGFPYPGNPHPEKPDTENTDTLINTHSNKYSPSLKRESPKQVNREHNKHSAVADASRPVVTNPGLAFEDFLKVYPRRGGANPRAPAEKKFHALLKSGVDPAVIIAGARAYADDCRNRDIVGSPYVAQAQTWLNQRRWETIAGGDTDQSFPTNNRKNNKNEPDSPHAAVCCIAECYVASRGAGGDRGLVIEGELAP